MGKTDTVTSINSRLTIHHQTWGDNLPKWTNLNKYMGEKRGCIPRIVSGFNAILSPKLCIGFYRAYPVFSQKVIPNVGDF